MKPFDIRTDVTLECPKCRTYKTVPRPPELPPAVRLIEIICPDCDDGDFHTETWFSAPGIEVSQDRGAKRDPRDPDYSRPGIFSTHNCWKCRDGELICVRLDPRGCEFPHARND